MPAPKPPPKLVLPKEVFLRSRPVRNPNVRWEKYPSGEVAIILKLRKTKSVRLLSLFVRLPEEKKLVLDKVGSRVWELCDGEHTVEDIIEMLMREYKLRRREAEVSLTAYLQQLIKRGLIGLLPPKELERAKKEASGQEEHGEVDQRQHQQQRAD